MQEIKIDLNCVLKLLSNLKPDKAAWPDSTKPVVLKQLKTKIAPVICLLFMKTFQTGNLPQTGKRHKSVPYLKKATKRNEAALSESLKLHLVK